MEQLRRQSNMERYLMRAVASWLTAVSLASLLAPLGETGGSLLSVVSLTVVCGALLTLAAHFWHSPYADTVLLCAAALLAAVVHVIEIRDPYFVFLVIFVLVMLGWLLFANNRLPAELPAISERSARITVGILAGALFLFLAILTALRYLCYYCPNYDFGIFSNMFYHMREDLTQTVSCERDAVMSHFDVHISPIYYLFLPFYAIIPSPITLLVLQAAVVAGGVVPLVLLAKRRGLKPTVTVLAAVVYLAYPAFVGGCFFDLHENKLLPILILSMVCAYESKRYGWMYLFAALVLLVKEDAPVYVAVFGLYLLLGRRAYRRGTILLIASVVYFLFATVLLELFGTGVMSWRYANISDHGLIGIFEVLFANPARIIAECLTAEKLVFCLQMLLPLFFLPLLTRRPARLLLLIPFVLVNLMSDYQYQHSIDFQYTYGSGALLFYAAILNLSELRERTVGMVIAGAATASVVMFAAFELPRTGIVTSYAASEKSRAGIAEVLASIPEDASVAADTFLVAHLAQRDLIFEYPSKNVTDYIVLDLRFLYGEDLERTHQTLLDSGYALVHRVDWAAALYQLTETEVTP